MCERERYIVGMVQMKSRKEEREREREWDWVREEVRKNECEWE